MYDNRTVVGCRGTTEAIFRDESSGKNDHGHSVVVIGWCVPLKLFVTRLNHHSRVLLGIYRRNVLKIASAEPALFNKKGPILLHDNARPHVSQITTQKLNESGVEVLPHPSYSPDLSPTVYHLFEHFHNFLAGQYSTNQDQSKKTLADSVNSRPLSFFI